MGKNHNDGELKMRKKKIVKILLGLLVILLIPPLGAVNPLEGENIFFQDPPFWEGSVELIKNTTFKVTVSKSDMTFGSLSCIVLIL